MAFCLLNFILFAYWCHWNKSQVFTQKQTGNFLFSFLIMHSFLAGNNMRTFVKFYGLPLHTNYILITICPSVMKGFDKKIVNVNFKKLILHHKIFTMKANYNSKQYLYVVNLEIRMQEYQKHFK